MPSLNWIGKEKIVNHDKDVPFRLLRKNKKYSLGESENLILEGDNLEALKALMPFYYGKIKCIYIDPPYNTGNEKWVYNDRVNSPKIKEWLGKVVGPEGEDLTRHDKWLCMMYPRLKLLRELLSDDGVIFVSIDDHEVNNLRLLMDDIFLENFIGQFSWKGKSGAEDDTYFRTVHEYILCYAKDKTQFKAGKREKIDEKFPKFDSRKNRFYKTQLARKWGSNSRRKDRPKLYYSIKAPDGANVYPKLPDGSDGCWRWSQVKMHKEIKSRNVEFVKDSNNWIVYEKIYKPTKEEGPLTKKFNTWLDDVGSTSNGTDDLKQIFGKAVFDHPKPYSLIERLLMMGSFSSDDIVLDSFAGSGTTAHAVLDLNKEDGGNRKFILVELEKNIAKNITAERVKRVAKGYSYKTGKGKAVKVAGLGGGFEYVELGELLFKADGNINDKVSFEEMASYVYFTETLTNIDKRKIKGNFIGEYNGTKYYLLFRQKGNNILNRAALKGMKKDTEIKVVYADKCLLGEEVLEKYNITFKQIPYQVKVY